MSGTAIATVIALFASPIVSRLYTPESFGVLAIYMTTLNMLSVVSIGRYQHAVLLPKNDKESTPIVYLCFIIISTFSIVSCVVVIFFNKHISLLLNSPQLRVWLYTIPFALFFTSSMQVFISWLLRKKRYRSIAYCRIYSAASSSISKISIGFLGAGMAGHVISLLIGYIVGTVGLLWNSWNTRAFDKTNINFSLLKKMQLNIRTSHFSQFQGIG